MDDEEYKSYKERAEFFNACGRTVEGLHGMIFRKDINIDVPGGTEQYLENVDGKGNSLNQFINDTAWDCLQTGFGGVLVDAPNAESIENKRDAEIAGIAPYITYYPAESILNWRFITTGRSQRLSMVVLKETYEKDTADKFIKQTANRYRVLELDENGNYVQSLYNEYLDLIYSVYPRKNNQFIRALPFYLLPSKQPEKPMMLDLASVNIAWYRKSADLENGAHWTGVPTPYVIGYEPETKYNEKGEEVPAKPIKLGGSIMLTFPIGVTAVNYLEFTGSGLSQLVNMMSVDEDRMAILGARIISQEKKGVESAEAAKIHRAGENSVLATFANNLSIVFTDIVADYLEWCTGGVPDFSIKLNTDYDVAEMSPAELTALVSCWQSGGISKRILFNKLKDGEVISSDESFDNMQSEIEEEQSIRNEQVIQA